MDESNHKNINGEFSVAGETIARKMMTEFSKHLIRLAKMGLKKTCTRFKNILIIEFSAHYGQYSQ